MIDMVKQREKKKDKTASYERLNYARIMREVRSKVRLRGLTFRMSLLARINKFALCI